MATTFSFTVTLNDEVCNQYMQAVREWYVLYYQDEHVKASALTGRKSALGEIVKALHGNKTWLDLTNKGMALAAFEVYKLPVSNVQVKTE